MTGRLSYDAAKHTGIESYSAGMMPDVPPRRKTPPSSSTRSSSLQPTKLLKPVTNSNHTTSSHTRAASAQFLTPHSANPNNEHHATRQMRSSSLSIPPTVLVQPMGVAHSRDSSIDLSNVSTPKTSISSTPSTPNLLSKPLPHHDTKTNWFGKRKPGQEDQGPTVWIAGHPQKFPYDAEILLRGNIVPELWDTNSGDCFIHLFPRDSGKGPSFKLDSEILASSPILAGQIRGQKSQERSISPTRTVPDPRVEAHIYLGLQLSDSGAAHGDHTKASVDDLQKLIDFRNLFAFLSGQSLVATKTRSSVFSIFLTISSLLQIYGFSSADGATYGDVANMSFNNYVEELLLADVRASREKTIEGIVLGEKMRNRGLYSESFTHAVGKLQDITALRSPVYNLVSEATKTRLSRAAFELEKREQAVRIALKDFDFPFIFAGIGNSKTAEERKEGVRFDAWKDAFTNTRRWVLSSLKKKYGDWPPKAKSKKNDLEVSGLQRLVLRELYHDMSSMYDLLVDRSALTTRTLDGIDRAGPVEAPRVRALRSILSEYDRSSPPVKPPVPFDLPILPTLRTTRPNFDAGDVNADAKVATKKLSDAELTKILPASWNSDVAPTPFIDAFRDMERRATRGSTLQELIDLRMGQWIFMYAVLQALPLLACDSPGLRHAKGVEYFLCSPPRGLMPWINPDQANQHRTWFSVGEAGGMVSLPQHVIEHSVAGVYRRSHCWTMAQKWTAQNPLMNQALQEQTEQTSETTPLEAEKKLSLSVPGSDRGRSSSPAARGHRHSSLHLGLEALPKSAEVPSSRSASYGGSKSAHVVDTSKTFDSIMAGMGGGNVSKK